MCWRLGWLACGILVFGDTLLEAQANGKGAFSAAALWDKGQEAMHAGHPEQAVALYQQSLQRAPGLTRNHLSLAAAYLELGMRDLACVHLGKYVAVHPEEMVLRSQYAELLLRLRHDLKARTEYERCVAMAQEKGGDKAAAHLIHCHSRLMEIAEARADEYAEHLHRGISLYLLAREMAGVAEPDVEMPSESLYCKAAGELTLARRQRPDEARPAWYLYVVWSQLAQRQPAQRYLREAGETAPFSYLTPAEQRCLHLAFQSQVVTPSAK